MKNAAVILILLVFVTGITVASPLDQGGGGSGTDEENNLSTILMITVVAGFVAIIVGDIISDRPQVSQDALAGIDPDGATEDTGVNWENLSEKPGDNSLPQMAVAVFQMNGGRELARYFNNLLAPGENEYYSVHGPPVSLGSMPPSEAAATGFTFTDTHWFITADSTGFQMFARGISEPVWLFNAENPDSASARAASASLIDFLSGE